MPNTWTNLHTHTVYSLLDGHGKIEAYMSRVVELGMTSLAITDHGNIHGWLPFYDAAVAAGIKPLLGSEMYQARKTRFDQDPEELAHGKANDELAQRGPLHLTVIARNIDGYRNLIKMSSLAYLEGLYGKPRIDHELLAEHANGLIVLSGCLNGEVAQHLLLDNYQAARTAAARMQDMIGREYYYLEIHDHGLEEQRYIIPDIIKLSKDIGAPLVPAGDCHYVTKEDSTKHDIYLCVSTGATIDQEGRFAFAPEEFYLKSYDEMRERFEAEWLANTMDVAEQVELELKFGELHFPSFDIPTDETVDEYLERNVWDGIRSRYGDPIPEIVREQTEHELGVVKRMGFQEYFLVVSDLVNWAKCLSGGTEVYALLPGGPRPISIADLYRHYKPEQVKLWNGTKWTQVVAWEENTTPGETIELTLRNGQRLTCTQDHRWPTQRGVVEARNLVTGDTFEQVGLPNEDRVVSGLDDAEIGWFLGLFLAEGSRSGKTIQITCHKDEVYKWKPRLDLLAEKYHGSCRAYIKNNTGNITLSGKILNAIIDTYIGGQTARSKQLLKTVWQRSNVFLRALLYGYLEGDGHWDKKNTRWRICFTDNENLVGDLRALSARIGGMSLHLRADRVKYGDSYVNTYRGDLRYSYQRRQSSTTVVAISRGSGNKKFYDIQVEDSPHTFALASGVMTHNSNGIRVGYGRGSAAGSILSYALRITNLDPIRFGLLFERFLVEGRKSMPDIDLDFDDRFRDLVIQYAREKYGDDRVAHIVTFGTVKGRTAIKDASRVLGYDYATGDKISKLMPPLVLGVSKTIDESLQSSRDFSKAYNTDEDARKIIDAARGLEGMVRQTGIHAAGVVIAKAPITEFIPVMKTASGIVVTQWDNSDPMTLVERCGQLKIDFLGLRNLSVIDRCLKHLANRRGIEIDLDDGFGLDDEKTYAMLRNGKSQGVFQLESGGMRQMMLAMQPASIEDLMALIALYRPGPLGSGMDKLYIERRHGRQQVRYYHEALEEVLGKTYGIMLYQEDILKVARVLAGFTVPEADDLRKAIGKKQMDKIGLFRDHFVEGCRDTHNVHPDVANKIYSDIEYFGGYGFNLAHSASYAMISYVTAYLKANYPAEYMAALLSSVDNTADAAPYLSECRALGIQVMPPSINRSESEFLVESDDAILCGLSAINGVGAAVVRSVLQDRSDPYTTMYDFFRRCNPEVLNKTTLENLIYAGAFDELVGDVSDRTLSRDEKMAVLDAEKRKLGLYVSDHPLSGIWHLFESQITASITDLDTYSDGSTVTVGGVITNLKEITTRRGDKMYKFDLEDLTDSVEVIVFPRAAVDRTFTTGETVIVTARVQQEGDEEGLVTKLIFTDVRVPVIPQYATGEPIIFRLDNTPTYAILDQMRQIIEDTPGDSSVYIEYKEGAHLVSLRFKRPASAAARQRLEEVVCLLERPMV